MKLTHFIFGILVVIAGLAHAGPVCAGLIDFSSTINITRQDQQVIIERSRQLHRTQTTEIIRNSGDLKYLTERVVQRTKNAQDIARSRNESKMALAAQAQQRAAQAREQAQALLRRNQDQREFQESRMRDLRQRAETMKLRQEFMLKK